MSGERRVVITGLGPISAVGIGREEFWAGLAEGRDGRRTPELLAHAAAGFPLLAECLDFAVQDYVSSEKTYLDRCSAFVLAACRLALDDAGLQASSVAPGRLGLSLCTAFGCLESMHTITARVQARGVRLASPMIFTHSFANSPASLAAIEYGLAGPTPTWSGEEASPALALQYAFDLVRWGRAEVMLAGGAEALSPALLAALRAGGEVAQGLVPGEGACLLVLESEAGARARGATALAELQEVAWGADAGGPAGAKGGLEGSAGETFGASLALACAAALHGGVGAAEAGTTSLPRTVCRVAGEGCTMTLTFAPVPGEPA